MRTVGEKDRHEIILDPVEAYRRGLQLDRMLKGTLPPPPRGVQRGTHAFFERLDRERQLSIARTVNAG